MVTVVCSLFVEIYLLVTFSDKIVLWKNISVKSIFLKCAMRMRDPKIWKKGFAKGREVQPNGINWDRLKYVEQVDHGQWGLHVGWNMMELEQVSLQIRWNRVEQWTGPCRAQPDHLFQNGTTRLWKISMFCVIFLHYFPRLFSFRAGWPNRFWHELRGNCHALIKHSTLYQISEFLIHSDPYLSKSTLSFECQIREFSVRCRSEWRQWGAGG